MNTLKQRLEKQILQHEMKAGKGTMVKVVEKMGKAMENVEEANKENIKKPLPPTTDISNISMDGAFKVCPL